MNDKKFLRTEILLSTAAMERLNGAIVAVFGIGGVGSFAVEALARSGIGHLVLIDHDVVDETNINRQLHATTKTIGQSKVELMKSRILEINPAAIVETIKEFYLPSDQSDKFFLHNYDYVIDAIDTITAKIDLVLECKRRGIKIISSMGAGNKLDPTKFKVANIFETSVDPIARVMRKKLKDNGINNLKVVYSTETPIKILNSTFCILNSELKTIGSVSFVPSVAGLILAGEVIKEIAGVNK
ncbi:MAG: tRNA threonylcarbamoyladenosine dehydratase [Selenomonadaceae bacterium]|nr:tRNA threonylcarbamoyladenosine dehydratase [Selenomonadaceae bacterium]